MDARCPGRSRQCGLTHVRECSTPPPVGRALLLRISYHKYCTLPGCHEMTQASLPQGNIPCFLKELRSPRNPFSHCPCTVPWNILLSFIFSYVTIYKYLSTILVSRDQSILTDIGPNPVRTSAFTQKSEISRFSPLAAMKRLGAKDRTMSLGSDCGVSVGDDCGFV